MEIKKINLKTNSDLTIIQTDKFKTTSIFLFLKGEVSRETATGYSFLYRMLSTATSAHPSISEMATYKDYLYGTTTTLTSVNRGEMQNTMLAVTTIDEHYVSEKGLLEKQFQLIHEILYQPLTEGERFNTAYFTERQRSLKRMLLSIEDDKESYSSGRLLDLLGNDPAAIRSYGYVQEVDEWTNERVYALYQQLLLQPIDIYVVGRVSIDEVTHLVHNYIKLPNQEVRVRPISQSRPIEAVVPVKEVKKFSQSQLGMVYTIDATYLSSTDYAAIMFNALFGSTPLSKLFKIVREEHGLCYSIHSGYNFTSGLISIMAGISSEKYEKAHQLIEELLDDMRKGNFSPEDLLLNQRLMVTTVRRQFDSAEGIVQYLFMHDLMKVERSLEQYVQGLMGVTKEEIQQVAASVKLRVDYFLEGKVD